MPIINTTTPDPGMVQYGDLLFNKVWRVTVDNLEVARHTSADISAGGTDDYGHDITFKVEKSLKPIPNTCELEIYNLNETQRSQLEQLAPTKASPTSTLPVVAGVPVKIEAGYGNNLSLIWLGDLRFVNTKREGPDWITVLEAGDGEKAHQNARINVAYGPKTPMDTALRAMIRAMGLGDGNVASVINQLQINGLGTIFSQGITLSGQASREITDFARSADLEWSIQDGAIQFLNRGKTLAESALYLTEDTGMLDSPTVDNDGVLTIKMMMIPDVRAGRLLVVNAARVKGNYRIEKVVYEGSTFTNVWDITAQGLRY